MARDDRADTATSGATMPSGPSSGSAAGPDRGPLAFLCTGQIGAYEAEPENAGFPTR